MQPEIALDMVDCLTGLLDRGLIGSEDAMPTLKRAHLISEDKTAETTSERGVNAGAGDITCKRCPPRLSKFQFWRSSMRAAGCPSADDPEVMGE